MESQSGDGDLSDHHIVKADEVDQTGADISAVSDDQLMPGLVQEFEAEKASRKEDEGLPELPQRHSKQAQRPELRRDTSTAPPPPLQPPPPAPVQPQTPEHPTDSLSLAQLRKIVHDMPKVDQPAYAFEYADCQPFPEELDEWFQYNEPDRLMLLGMKASFEQYWSSFLQETSPAPATADCAWIDADEAMRTRFLEQTIPDLGNDHIFTSVEALEIISYILSGVWGSTGGKAAHDYPEEPVSNEAAEAPRDKSLQIKWIEQNALLVKRCGGIPALFHYITRVFDEDQTPDNVEFKDFEGAAVHAAAKDREINLLLTALYFLVEVARRLEASDVQNHELKEDIAALQPGLLVFLVEVIARLRWNEGSDVPVTRLLLLFWKSILLLFGGTDSLQKVKTVLEPEREAEDGAGQFPAMPVLKASPLDYHIFRQEVTSKYPAYNPPPPLVPLDLAHNSILPPLSNYPGKGTPSGLFSGTGPSSGSDNTSILHQPVHIATPAPSPPPSPVGPNGKTGKKQNYQTNQHFPFMYPPLDQTSNDIGGKGSGGQQDSLVGKKWDGGDVPASIIEAGKLFSSRTKMTRAIRQLWEERERFLKYDRGWEENEARNKGREVRHEGENVMSESSKSIEPSEDVHTTKETDDGDVQGRLDAVEEFYAKAMPNLQSIVIVLLKEILTNITAIASRSDGDAANGHRGSIANPNDSGNSQINEAERTVEEIDGVRYREIKAKAISGTLLLLLKWFKRSHVLKFEYMTQLLLDSNYMPLVLKMFIHQDVDKAVSQKNEREDLSFFSFCREHSDGKEQAAATAPEESGSEDEAIPPPIPRHNRSQVSQANNSNIASERIADQTDSSQLPEVDELGFPTAPLPNGPITTYSFRNFFSAINLLHVMQKITRDKAHRCLLLVQYKSSTILRKGIKIPDPHLRLYTLKLFKSQVPYCGRKWRQTHMRIITAIYLYCRPELRDDWLAGSAVEAEVEEALPMEQALRGLTHWWHLKQYKNSMAIEEQAIMDDERDFFTRELEGMSWGMMGEESYNGLGEDEAAGMPGQEFEGPMQATEGWQ